jgi:hypothetical protein
MTLSATGTGARALSAACRRSSAAHDSGGVAPAPSSVAASALAGCGAASSKTSRMVAIAADDRSSPLRRRIHGAAKAGVVDVAAAATA